MNINIGYCCINTILRKDDIFTSRTCRLKTLKENGIEYSYKLAKQNLLDLKTIIEWNYKNKIYLFRMSSEMFPFSTHPDYHKQYNIEQFKEMLQEIGELAIKYNQRLTFHPGQYNQLTSRRSEVSDKAIIDIDFHSKILDYMGLDNHSIIIIHGGSKQDGMDEALNRFCMNFDKLSGSSKNRLVIENDEIVYNIEDLLELSHILNIPIVIDYHHHNLNPGTCNLNDITQKVLEVWNKKSIKPLFHVSESRIDIKPDDSIMKRRAHGDYVYTLPNELIKLSEDVCIDVDIEAKMKEQSVLKLYNKYPELKKF